jgi:hypothetical protein
MYFERKFVNRLRRKLFDMQFAPIRFFVVAIMSTPPKQFQVNIKHLTAGPPTQEGQYTNPVSVLLACGQTQPGPTANPPFHLIHSRVSLFGEYEPQLFATLTASSPTPLEQPDPSRPRFWFKDYSENEGLLRQLEGLAIVKRIGQTLEQGFVTLQAVEVIMPVEDWARCCGNVDCGIFEDLDSKARMKRCSRCSKTYYCDAGCQKGMMPGPCYASLRQLTGVLGGWSLHKKYCNVT